jgi:hypothetical protein
MRLYNVLPAGSTSTTKRTPPVARTRNAFGLVEVNAAAWLSAKANEPSPSAPAR